MFGMDINEAARTGSYMMSCQDSCRRGCNSMVMANPFQVKHCSILHSSMCRTQGTRSSVILKWFDSVGNERVCLVYPGCQFFSML